MIETKNSQMEREAKELWAWGERKQEPLPSKGEALLELPGVKAEIKRLARQQQALRKILEYNREKLWKFRARERVLEVALAEVVVVGPGRAKSSVDQIIQDLLDMDLKDFLALKEEVLG